MAREMKDSGIEWIGIIPTSWTINKIKHNFSIVSGATPKSENMNFWDGDICWITPADYKTQDKYVSHGKRNISQAGYDSCGTKLVPVQSIVFSKRAPVGTVAITKNELCTNQGCLSCVPKDNTNSIFYYYAMTVFTEQFELVSTGTTFKEIALDVFSNFYLPHPSLYEQNIIANFLDAECARIDAVIKQIRSSIEEYKKLKQAVITQAVTKGIRPNQQMKDSGIQWIGEIPNDWITPKMSAICLVITDYVASGSFASLAENVEYLDEPDYAMLVRTADVSNKGYNPKPVYINRHAYDFLRNSNLFGGELMFPNIGASVGDVYIVPKLYERMSLAPNAIIVKTNHIDKFFYYYFQSKPGRLSIEDIAQSTAQAKFNKTDFRQLRVLLPSDQEQQEIVEYLDNKIAEIDALISRKETLLAELEKYKKSLIYEYVTGKKEVPE